MLEKYLAFAARKPVLAASFIGMVSMIFMFQLLPGYVGGDMIDTIIGGYDHAKIMELMKGYGEQGRAFYALASPTIDTLVPLIYVTFFAGLIYALVEAAHLKPLVYVPIAGGIADLLENAQIVLMLVQYPDISAGQVAVASMFTWIKFIFLWASMLIILVLLPVRGVRWLIDRIDQRR